MSYVRIKDVKEIEKVLNNDFENISDWFVNSNLRSHAGEDKTTSMIPLVSKCKIKNIKKT